MRSHPVRVRGLKLRLGGTIYYLGRVAPRAGAWIETTIFAKGPTRLVASHPVRVRGLKQRFTYMQRWGGNVAPRAGAGIETL